jgi:hypothetical protein
VAVEVAVAAVEEVSVVVVAAAVEATVVDVAVAEVTVVDMVVDTVVEEADGKYCFSKSFPFSALLSLLLLLFHFSFIQTVPILCH